MLFCSKCYNLILLSAAEKSKMTAVLFTSSTNLSTFTQNKIHPINSFRFTNKRQASSWSADTHYTVLGVDYEASPRQIRNAYLKLSKELHPDTNQGKSEKESQEVHNKFVRLNQAYSVLGNEKLRAAYDLEILVRQDPRWKGDSTGNTMHTYGQRMTFDERAAAMGFKKQDPNYYAKHGNYHRRVVLWCIGFIIFGAIVQSTAVLFLYRRHNDQMERVNRDNIILYNQAKGNARERLAELERYNYPIQNGHRITSYYSRPIQEVPQAIPVEEVKEA